MAEEQSQSLLHITDGEFKEITGFVYRRYGIDLSRKRQLIEGRLSYTVKSKGYSSFGPYFEMLRSDKNKGELEIFLNKITTNYSYFSRESEHFRYLIEHVLPELTRTRRNDLRIWSAGCSSGQEPYNIAMANDQFFGANKGRWDSTILATDISANVLQKARRGVYSAEDIKNMPASWRVKYFNKLQDGSYQVSQEIRKEVVFRTFNLMDPIVAKKPFDIIFCRNVMIYFDAATTAALLQRFYNATAPGGYLFIGHSESIDRTNSGYSLVHPAVYKK